MPPVRDASAKPSAATVLPEPVACSNQKRLLAFGSSAASASCFVVVGGRLVPVHRLVGLVLVELLLARDPDRRQLHLGLGDDPVAVAVAVALDLGEQRGERAGEHVDLMGGEHRAVHERRLVLAQQPLEAEQQ